MPRIPDGSSVGDLLNQGETTAPQTPQQKQDNPAPAAQTQTPQPQAPAQQSGQVAQTPAQPTIQDPAKGTAGQQQTTGDKPEGSQPPATDDPEAARREHYQTTYQNVLKFMNERAPELRRAWDEERYGTAPAPQIPRDDRGRFTMRQDAQGNQLGEQGPPGTNEFDDEFDFTDRRQLQKMIRDTVVQANQEIRQQDQQYEAEQAAVREQTAFRREFSACSEQANQLEQAVPPEVFKKAIENVNRYYGVRVFVHPGDEKSPGIPGGPTAFLQGLVREVDLIMQSHEGTAQTVGQIAAVTAHAKNAALTQQPAPASVATPKEETENQKHLNRMKAAGGDVVGTLMSGTG